MALDPFPADDPIWNTDGTNRTTPTGLKQAAGWTLSEEPPSGYFNWWMFYVSEYIQHYKTAATFLESDKLSRQGGEMSGTITVDFDQVYDLGAAGMAFQTFYGQSVDVGKALPRTGDPGASLGTSLRPWPDIFADDVDINNTLSALTASFENVSVGSTLTVTDVVASGYVSADEVIVGEFGHSSVRGIRELDVTRATLVIDKPGSIAFSQATHEVHQSNIGVVSVSGTEMTVNLVLPMNTTKYGIHFSGCRGIGTGQTDLMMAQFYGKTSSLFKAIFYYWDGAAWLPLTLDGTSAAHAIRAVISVVGRES